MGLFNKQQLAKIQEAANKSKAAFVPPAKAVNSNKMNAQLEEITQMVTEYFSDSPAQLITTVDALNDYVDKAIECGICGLDCETTGLDRVRDHVVGFSLYYPGDVEVYIPNKHLVPIFDQPYRDQLTYEDCIDALQKLADSSIKLIFANADFDLAMMRKDFKVDLSSNFYYDVILGWRCMKENERDNRLKVLYNKYVLKGKGDPKTFSDFFSAELFPYARPHVAKLYAANDPKITVELADWQFPYCDKTHKKCQKAHLEAIADIIWNLEMPLVPVCHELHHVGMYIDKRVGYRIRQRYRDKYDKEIAVLQNLVQEAIDKSGYIPSFSDKVPFTTGKEFNPDSNPMVRHLIIKILKLPLSEGEGTGKEYLSTLNNPVTEQILKVRSLKTLIGTFTDKLVDIVAPDGRIHASFKQIGADTGRMSSQDPNLQNIPSRNTDIRHMFRATPKGCEHYDCRRDDEYLVSELPMYYYIRRGDDDVLVSDVELNDIVTIYRDNIPEQVQVVFSEEVARRVGNYKLKFKISDECIDPSSKGWQVRLLRPPYIMVGSDYSAQEPRITSFISGDKKMQEAFIKGQDVYGTIASVSFGVPYEQCLEFDPVTGEYQPDGKRRRGEAKTILLGICYGRSIPSIADQLYGHNDSMSDKEKIEGAQKVYDSVMIAFPGLRDAMNNAQAEARKFGYVQTILGRRRHLPDMQLPQFDFEPMDGYINPDVDPLNPDESSDETGIPTRIKSALLNEFSEYKYWGQIVKHSKKLAQEHNIRVINNRPKINDASRQTLNSKIQGSAADMTKMAILQIANCDEWKRLGARLLVPVHDELICECPIQNYERVGELLSSLMCKAGSFLPFPSKCDVEYSFRWYGLEFPCPYKKPENVELNIQDFSNMSDEDICWIQYCLTECEYQLPIYKNPDGSKPEGMAAHGVNGCPSDELSEAIVNYLESYNISSDEFFDHIEQIVFDGVVTVKGGNK